MKEKREMKVKVYTMKDAPVRHQLLGTHKWPHSRLESAKQIKPYHMCDTNIFNGIEYLQKLDQVMKYTQNNRNLDGKEFTQDGDDENETKNPRIMPNLQYDMNIENTSTSELDQRQDKEECKISSRGYSIQSLITTNEENCISSNEGRPKNSIINYTEELAHKKTHIPIDESQNTGNAYTIKQYIFNSCEPRDNVAYKSDSVTIQNSNAYIKKERQDSRTLSPNIESKINLIRMKGNCYIVSIYSNN